MKKLFCLMIVLSLIFTAMPVNAQTDFSDYSIYAGSIPAELTMADSEYYGKSLTDFQKGFYRAFVDKFTELNKGTLFLKQAVEVEYTVETSDTFTLQEEFNVFVNKELSQLKEDLSTQTLYNAIQYDHTEIFWMREAGFDIGVGATADENGTTLVFTVTMSVDSSKLFTDERQMQAAASDVETTVQSILAKAPNDTYEAVEYFNNWLKEHNTYNHTHLENDSYPLAHTAYSAFVSNNDEPTGPVCQGYAYAFKYLCDRAGIECVVVSGTLYQSLDEPGPHAWNAVKIDGSWYGIDVTSNDSLGTDEYNFLVGSTTASHDLTYTTFGTSHVADSTHTYPTLSLTAYEPPKAEIASGGTNIRLGDKAGLRFKTVINKNAFYDKYYPAEDEGKSYVYDDSNNLMFGTLLVLTNSIPSDSSLQEMFENDDKNVVNVPAKKIFSEDSEALSFTAVIIEIPRSVDNYSLEITAIPYVKYRNNGESGWVYSFGEETKDSYYNVAKKARESDYSGLNNPDPSEEVKEIMNQLDDIIDLVEQSKN